jgi:hypothetical protein
MAVDAYTDSPKSRTRMRDLLSKYTKGEEEEEKAGDLLTDEALADLPEKEQVSKHGLEPEAKRPDPKDSYDETMVSASVQGGISPEEAARRSEEYIDPGQFEWSQYEPFDFEDEKKAVASEVAGEGTVEKWIGGGGWKYELHGGAEPYIVATPSGQSASKHGTGGRKVTAKDPMFDEIVAERDRLKEDPEEAVRAVQASKMDPTPRTSGGGKGEESGYKESLKERAEEAFGKGDYATAQKYMEELRSLEAASSEMGEGKGKSTPDSAEANAKELEDYVTSLGGSPEDVATAASLENEGKQDELLDFLALLPGNIKTPEDKTSPPPTVKADKGGQQGEGEPVPQKKEGGDKRVASFKDVTYPETFEYAEAPGARPRPPANDDPQEQEAYQERLAAWKEATRIHGEYQKAKPLPPGRYVDIPSTGHMSPSEQAALREEAEGAQARYEEALALWEGAARPPEKKASPTVAEDSEVPILGAPEEARPSGRGAKERFTRPTNPNPMVDFNDFVVAGGYVGDAVTPKMVEAYVAARGGDVTDAVALLDAADAEDQTAFVRHLSTLPAFVEPL